MSKGTWNSEEGRKEQAWATMQPKEHHLRFKREKGTTEQAYWEWMGKGRVIHVTRRKDSRVSCD